ncbi:MAG TPA: peptide ABC transporter substrate-binding protein, partial [Tepidisphaeraceae bacterium]
FHIRDTARWSDGEDLLASDFVFAWRRMLEEPGDYTYLFHYIAGAQAYEEAYAMRAEQRWVPDGKGSTMLLVPEKVAFATVGIEAVDGKTLRVKLGNPVPFFPDLCAFAPFYPLQEKSMRKFAQDLKHDGHISYDPSFTTPPNLVTNGPYRLESWQYRRRLRLAANEHYWDRASIKSPIIDQISAEDPSVQFNIYQAGRVDWLSDVSPDIAAELRKKGREDLHVFPGFGTYFYSINCNPKLPDGRVNPLIDVRVRQALAMAIDKRPIVENVTRMGEPVTENYIPRGIFPKYRSPNGLPHDIERAKKLLAEAGYPGGKGFPKVGILFNTGAHHDAVAQIIARQWQTELGINVGLEGVEVKIFGNRLRSQDYAIARASWIGDYNDPSTFTDKYLSVSENNDSKWVSREYDDLCAAAVVEADPAKRLELLSQAEEILLREAPIIPIYSYVNVDMSRPNVKGIPRSPRNMINFKSVEVER